MKSATLSSNPLNGPPHDPVSVERREIAHLLRTKADHHEKRAGEIQHNEALSLTRKKAAGSYRALAQQILDRPTPDPTSRPFTSDEREALKVLLDQLFEAAGGQGVGHAIALADQLGLQLDHKPTPPPISVAPAHEPVVLVYARNVIKAYAARVDMEIVQSPAEEQRMLVSDSTGPYLTMSVRRRIAVVFEEIL